MFGAMAAITGAMQAEFVTMHKLQRKIELYEYTRPFWPECLQPKIIRDGSDDRDIGRYKEITWPTN